MTFSELFKGNDSSFGRWSPKTGKMFTEKKKATDKEFNIHLDGGMGIGRVPIMDDGTCWWGAIDIDNHDDVSKPININAIAKTIFAKGLPLIPCRSKSGGVHCYVFLSEPIPAPQLKKALEIWSKDINYEGSEVFPKQGDMVKDSRLGNWLNLPYHDAKKTERYAVEVQNGIPVKLTLDQFLSYSKSKKLSLLDIKSFILSGHEQAPPCIQRILLEGVSKGYRNETVYALTIYFRQKLPASEYKQAVLEVNKTVFAKPLQLSEINRTIQSASRKEYKYKCQEDPCRSYCNSEVCVTREFGIDSDDTFATGDNLPDFSRLKVINTEPPIWEITINGIPIAVQTKVLRSFPMLAEEVMEKLYLVIPIIKQKDWMRILSELMEKVEHISAPDDASVAGVIRAKLCEFASRVDLNTNGKDTADRDLIDRGHPIVQDLNENGKRSIIFRGTDFVTFLKRTRSEELKGNALWVALRKMGVGYKRIRVNGSIRNVWYLPIDGKGRTKLDHDYDPNSVFVHSDQQKVVKIMNEVNF